MFHILFCFVYADCSSRIMEEKVFEKWLEDLNKTLLTLSSEQRTKVLDQVIKQSDPKNLFHLSTHLKVYTKRDFLSLLPPELIERVLCYLDWRTLLICRSTSRAWRAATDSAAKAWRQACVKLGVLVEQTMATADEYRSQFRLVYWQQKLLASGEALEVVPLQGHDGDVRAMHCTEGLVITGQSPLSCKVTAC